MYNLADLLRDEVARQRLGREIAGSEPASMLRSVKIKIISNCNLRCEMCRYWQIAGERLEKETVFAALESAAALGCQKVHLSGGEVTLHGDLPAIIRRAADLGMRVNLTSNGIIMDKARARAWIDAGLRAASFSLDGVTPKMHDKIRGVRGAFKRTVRTIRIVRREIERRKARLRVRVNTVLSRQNFRQLPDLIRLAGELGAIDVLPMPIDGKNCIRPTVKEIESFNHDIAPQAFELRKQFRMPLDAGRLYPFGRTEREMALATEGKYGFGRYEQHPCFAPWLHAFVSHTGEVFACCMTRERMDPLGNVKHQSLADIFQGPRYVAFRQAMLKQRLSICGLCDQYLRENRLVENRLAWQNAPANSLPILETVK